MLSTTFWCQSWSSSGTSAAPVDHIFINDTGRSNSIHVFHWSALSFPWVGKPKLAGGPACQVGHIVFFMSSCIWRKSSVWSITPKSLLAVPSLRLITMSNRPPSRPTLCIISMPPFSPPSKAIVAVGLNPLCVRRDACISLSEWYHHKNIYSPKGEWWSVTFWFFSLKLFLILNTMLRTQCLEHQNWKLVQRSLQQIADHYCMCLPQILFWRFLLISNIQVIRWLNTFHSSTDSGWNPGVPEDSGRNNQESN